MSNQKVDEINQKLSDIFKSENRTFFNETLEKLDGIENDLLKLCNRRTEYVSEFRTLPDFVSITDAALFLFCGEVDLNTERSIGIHAYAQHHYESSELSSNTSLPDSEPEWLLDRLKNYLLTCLGKVEHLIITGAYVYGSPLKSSKALDEDSKEYSTLKDIIDLVWTAISDNASEDSISQLNKLNGYYVSRSEMNQLTLFNSSRHRTSTHHKEVRKQAYRLYLQTGFLENAALLDDPSKTTILTQERRELVLLGWMAGKGLKKGERIKVVIDKKTKTYQRLQVWHELVTFCPQEFDHAMKVDSVESFFKKAVKGGICRFS